MNPRYPIYVVSKGRWKSRLTAKNLEEIDVPYRIVVEPQEVERYAAVIDRRKILALPFSDRGLVPARNWIWEHSVGEGHARHWILDDNIDGFYRYNRNLKVKVSNGSTFAAAEDFTDRYANVPMSGMNYFMFVSRKSGNIKPVTFNTRIYSCILLSNDVPHRWRGRSNDDTDLSLRFLKDGFCTILFNAFLALKQQTMTMRGGCTDLLYQRQHDDRLEITRMLQRQHPDVVKIVWKWGRWQHQVDYSRFKSNRLIRREGATVRDGVDDYGMRLIHVAPKGSSPADRPRARKKPTPRAKAARTLKTEDVDVFMTSLTDFVELCETAGADDVDAIRRSAVAKTKDRLHRDEQDELRRRWYASLSSGDVDYGVYDAEMYLAELWACWVIYSRRYITMLREKPAVDGQSIFSIIGDVGTAIDLGCGIGFTTAAIKQTFPDARVIGTNIDGSIQTRVAREIGRRRGFEVLGKIPELRDGADLVFASDYFEHILEPVEHLQNLIRDASPSVIITANSFNTISTGHFITYVYDGALVPQRSISRIFNAALRAEGYEKIRTTFWNQRPAYWKRITR